MLATDERGADVETYVAVLGNDPSTTAKWLQKRDIDCIGSIFWYTGVYRNVESGVWER